MRTLGPMTPTAPPPVTLTTRQARAWSHPQPWIFFLAVGLTFTAIGTIDGRERVVLPLVTAMGLITVGAILYGLRTHRPVRRLPWQLQAVCILLTTIGAQVSAVGGAAASLGQALTGIGAAAGVGGLILLLRGRLPGGDRAALLDGAILVSGTGAVVWAFGFEPLLISRGDNSIVVAIFFFPGLVALATVIRMWFMPGAHRPATRFIVLFVVASNAVILVEMFADAVGPRLFGPLYLCAAFAVLTFVGTAALHPSMAILPARQHSELQPVGRRRIVALTAALLVNPATLGIEVALGHTIAPLPYLISGALIGLLVIGRLADALRQLGESVAERDSLMGMLRRQALYDTLTALPNRNLFTERLASEYANRSEQRLLSVLLVDLDDFKAVNDSYGHEVGDALLISVGQRLRLAIREGDTAARLGGDEFVVALPDCAHPSVALRIAQRVLASLAEPFDLGPHRLSVRASVGVALAGTDDVTADELVRNADIAMYLAKSRGKGRVEVFEQSMQAAAANQLRVRAELGRAIPAGDLRLHFQPVVDLGTGRTIGYEALVRWLRDGRLVPPSEFIPVAESSGLIGPLTDWVLDRACRTMAQWGEPDDRPWVSVNLSSSQLIRADIVTRIARTLEVTGMQADRLVIEITESSLLEIDVARPAIERLSGIGVRLAIDDFGVGYSALSYLARLPIDIVKIDRSFVMALEHAGPEEAIASAIIALAKRLGLTTIGEGIETRLQLDQLVALGCDLGQGYFLGRPAAAEDLRSAPSASGRRHLLPRLASLTA